MWRRPRSGGHHTRQASHDGESDPGAGSCGVPGHHPLSAPGSRHVSVVDQGRPSRQSNGFPDVGDGHGCGRTADGDDPPGEPCQYGEDRRSHHADASRRPCRTRHVADLARRRGGTRSAGALLRARGGDGAGDGALVVPSVVYVTEDARLFIALGTPDLHDARRAHSITSRGQSPGRAGARRAHQPRLPPAPRLQPEGAHDRPTAPRHCYRQPAH